MTADGTLLGYQTEHVAITGGQSAHHIAYDDTETLALTVHINRVEHLTVHPLYAVHYTIVNHSHPTRPGLPVHGELSTESMACSEQKYELQEPIVHGTSRDHY